MPKQCRFRAGLPNMNMSHPHRNSSNSSRVSLNAEEMDFSMSDDELLASQLDENELLCHDEFQLPLSANMSNRKRPFNSDQSLSPGAKIFNAGGDSNMPSTSNFSDEDDDDEMVSILNEYDPFYGLLGITDQTDAANEQLNQLPDELLQSIFGFLPIMDLYKNVSLVCHKWNELVRDSLFIPWKKLYYQYVAKEEQAVKIIECLLQQNGITSEDESCILNLIKYFATFKGSRVADFKVIMDSLKSHHLFPVAEACILQRFPDLAKISEAVRAWAIFAVMILLSYEVGDIQKLVRCLQYATLRQVEIIETMYCMATLLFAAREQKILISNRIHYNIFYCLHLLESRTSPVNTSFYTISKKQSNLILTNEQRQILNHDIAPGHVVKIMAFAGTGKTSTLIKYAEKRPQFQFLYASFNNAIVKHACGIFPENVTCRTFHSLAYKEIGIKYRKKLNPTKLTTFAVNCVLPDGKGGYCRAKLVAKTLETFFSSADDSLETDHVPIRQKDSTGQKVLVKPVDQSFAVWQANEIWKKMKDFAETKQPAYKMTHDGYLKLWQLRNPKLSNYDAIFIDEAQDCTPSIMKIIRSQTCGKIFVGDPHQQIYTFRGAVNALCEVMHTHIFYLTQSFRFGAEIAYVGATILDACKKVRNKTLVGGSQEGTIRGHDSKGAAILCRTNAFVFDEAVRVTEGDTPSKIHIIGGPENFGLNKILDIWILKQSKEVRFRDKLYIKDKSIYMWISRGGFDALKHYAATSEDRELEGKIAIVEKYNIRIPELINRIKNCNTERIYADYIIGTVHKAKGLEFDTVSIADDFVKLPTSRHNMERLQFPMDVIPDDEWNLLYVAVTRAKKHLVLTKNIENILTLAGEYFLTAELTSQVLKDGPVSCVLSHCNNHIPEDTVLTMKKLSITYSLKAEDKGGYICHSCVLQRVGPVTQLFASLDFVRSMDFELENIELPRHLAELLEAI
uniref:F-box DNA helicase 1 n=1 Tax=Leptobrachium leishanense TaxID=445787 RepID=A0A8C5PCP3_9ANUR